MNWKETIETAKQKALADRIQKAETAPSGASTRSDAATDKQGDYSDDSVVTVDTSTTIGVSQPIASDSGPTTTAAFLVGARERMAALRAERGEEEPPTVEKWDEIAKAAQQGLPTGLEDLSGRGTGPMAQYRDAVDDACKSITIDEVYQRLPGAFYDPDTKGKSEGKKISCPNPQHPDTHPSAWINTDKGLYNCSGCAQGSDKYEIAAWLYGMPVPGYKKKFNELCERMAAEFRGVEKPTQSQVAPIEPPPLKREDPVDPDAIPDDLNPTYSWREIMAMSPVTRPTFLSEWCEATERDTTPTEFNLFNGMLALGLAAGNKTVMVDNPTVSGNFGICVVARSGAGKSRSTNHVIDLLRRKADRLSPGGGVTIRGTAFSGQVVVKSLIENEPSPLGPKFPPLARPLKVLFEYPELSEIGGGASLQGSILKTKLQEVIDGKSVISYYSVGQGDLSAEGGFGAVITTTQPKSIRVILKEKDTISGFMNRFLFLMGRQKRQLSRGAVPLDFANADDLYETAAMWANRPDGRRLDFTKDADEYWDKLYQTKLEPMKDQDESDILNRVDLYLKRMMLIFAINEHSEIIELHHVQMAEALIKYLLSCYQRVIGALLQTDNREMAMWLTQKIQMMEEKALRDGKELDVAGPTQAELRRHHTHKGWETWQVTRCLKELMEAGIITAKQAKGKRGASCVRYYVLEAD